MSNELKPCPRCGSHAERVPSTWAESPHIRCANIHNCDCETRLGDKSWNRRTAPAGGREGVIEAQRFVPFIATPGYTASYAMMMPDRVGGYVKWEDYQSLLALSHPAPDTVRVPQATKMQDGPPAGPFDSKAAYFELIMAVGNKYPNETRHQTALRYIMQAERGSNEPAQSAKQRGG